MPRSCTEALKPQHAAEVLHEISGARGVQKYTAKVWCFGFRAGKGGDASPKQLTRM